MSAKHRTSAWVQVRALVRPRLEASLPHPCPRCGQLMAKGMRLDLGHISRAPALAYEPGNLRLEHRACNRADGARITVAKRAKRRIGERMPSW